MTSTKTLVLATVAALSLGAGSAMAQESADGAFNLNLWAPNAPAQHQTAPTAAQPQAGSSDFDQSRVPVYQNQNLIGSDGNG